LQVEGTNVRNYLNLRGRIVDRNVVLQAYTRGYMLLLLFLHAFRKQSIYSIAVCRLLFFENILQMFVTK
jgi:hypothetical protein